MIPRNIPSLSIHPQDRTRKSAEQTSQARLKETYTKHGDSVQDGCACSVGSVFHLQYSPDYYQWAIQSWFNIKGERGQIVGEGDTYIARYFKVKGRTGRLITDGS